MQILERENVMFWIYRENLGKNEEIKKEYKNPLAGMASGRIGRNYFCNLFNLSRSMDL